ncbi:hypothetical protein [Kitasatospora sp. NPDC059803]|uniref:hypothetical protein n=1 Tax=Kitasatospora sp. NPDC059803 TaxID=3346953 RepID=UPI0036636229
MSAIAPAIAISEDGALTAPSAQPGNAPKKKLPAGATGAAALLGAAKPEVIELMKKQEVLDKVVDRITGGQEEQNRDRIPGFSEVEVDPGVNEGDGNAADDTIGIVPRDSQHSGGYVYGGPWNESSGYALQVSGSGGNNVGDYVCHSAANSGAHCGLRVLQVDRQIQGPNKVWRKFADQVVQTDPNDIAAANGDSGGPVVTELGGGKLQARGTITSLEKETNCGGRATSDGGTRTPWCFNGMWYVPISQTLADMGWVLRTDNP